MVTRRSSRRTVSRKPTRRFQVFGTGARKLGEIRRGVGTGIFAGAGGISRARSLGFTGAAPPSGFQIHSTKAGFVRLPVGATPAQAEKAALLTGLGLSDSQKFTLARGGSVSFKGKSVKFAQVVTQKKLRATLSDFNKRTIRTLERQGKQVEVTSKAILSIDPRTRRKTVISRRTGDVVAKVPISARVDVGRIGALIEKKRRARLTLAQKRAESVSERQRRIRIEAEKKARVPREDIRERLLRIQLEKSSKSALASLKQFGVTFTGTGRLLRRLKNPVGILNELRTLLGRLNLRAFTKAKEFTDKQVSQLSKSRKRLTPKQKKDLILALEKSNIKEKNKIIAGIKGIARVERLVAGARLIPEFTRKETIGFGIGLITGTLQAVEFVRTPIKSTKALGKALKQPKKLVKAFGKEFTLNPGKVVGEFIGFSKTMGLFGKTIRLSPVGRFVREEAFILRQPRAIRPFVRAIIKSAKAQEIINPRKIKSIARVNFLDVKSLTKAEAIALRKVLQSGKIDAVVFGSKAARVLSGGRTPKPKDVDIATSNVALFSREFINNLPRAIRKNYKIVGQKVFRVTRGQRVALFDIKPLSRLIPAKGLLGRGRLPVVGFKKAVVGVKRLKKILTNVKKINKLKFKLRLAKTAKLRSSILKQIKKAQATLNKQKKGLKLSDFTRKQRVAVEGALTIPTQKIVKVKGIRLVGFGEQTTRKALGTLEVLIKKSFKRAKDPQAFIISLKVQLGALKKLRAKTPIGRIIINRRINIIQNALKVLQSKAFAEALRKRVPSILKRFPLLRKINFKKLDKLNIGKLNKRASLTLGRLRTTDNLLRASGLSKKTKTKVKRSVLPKARKIPSRLPKRLPSKVPSKIPSRIPTRIPKPSKMPSALSRLSKVPSLLPSFIPLVPSKLIPSKLPKPKPSRVPPSRVPPSRIPPSRVPPSRLPPSRIPPLIKPPPKIPRVPPPKKPPKRPPIIIEKKKLKQLGKLLKGKIVKKKFIYIPDLYSVIYNVKANPAERKFFLTPGRIFTGIFIRKITKR